MDKNKRSFLKLSAAASASMFSGVMLSALLPGRASAAPALQASSDQTAAAISPAPAISLDECRSQNCRQTAERSPMVMAAWAYLSEEIAAIKNAGLRRLVSDVYADSTPRLGRFDSKQRQDVWRELSAAGYTSAPAGDFLPPRPQDMGRKYPFLSAPGSGYGSHHAYPGGLVTHVAANVRITRGIIDTYVQVYGYEVNRDVAMAAQLLHDLHKPYVFQWQADSSSRAEQPLAGTGEHHVFSLAELLVRKAPAELVVAQACAHTHPGGPADEAQVVHWLKAAAIIAGVEPVGYGLLDRSGNTLPLPRRQEGFICHLGDHDFVLSVPAVQWTLPALRQMAVREYKLSERDLAGKPFNSLRNQVYAQLSAMRLQQAMAAGGESFRSLVRSVVRPV